MAVMIYLFPFDDSLSGSVKSMPTLCHGAVSTIPCIGLFFFCLPCCWHTRQLWTYFSMFSFIFGHQYFFLIAKVIFFTPTCPAVGISWCSYIMFKVCPFLRTLIILLLLL